MIDIKQPRLFFQYFFQFFIIFDIRPFRIKLFIRNFCLKLGIDLFARTLFVELVNASTVDLVEGITERTLTRWLNCKPRQISLQHEAGLSDSCLDYGLRPTRHKT
ncbi:uncharacterized protein SPPG_09285 [Spizellomyces punctatus DAOM BR117]|uniref:Uncharacterized protein n=1 Tax=Spizellomyces punctatus (strain DAOM BR117) TaxID=645134 RepID=A0A0L0HDT0_SPIPD|nr:uncharacterized protein SPPG_09285 [Spizellomyces punctatus DAOM BR117]KNC99277.1 hypothetical protein SPPG_09285 [Spizellomyces punctatus DAOM BR117]|eukprot:XP_016607317.1 hypothetical protein SPPG_09285 [Spizellomyces punctatus DAOM BR117]